MFFQQFDIIKEFSNFVEIQKRLLFAHTVLKCRKFPTGYGKL